MTDLNHGYDDARGDYTAVVADHLVYRYEVMGMLGRGSFGQVMKCRDHADGSVVAVKIIRNKTRFHTQALVEVEILDRLRSKVCVLRAPLTSLSKPPFTPKLSSDMADGTSSSSCLFEPYINPW